MAAPVLLCLFLYFTAVYYILLCFLPVKLRTEIGAVFIKIHLQNIHAPDACIRITILT